MILTAWFVFFTFFLFQAEDGIRGAHYRLEFRRVLFRSVIAVVDALGVQDAGIFSGIAAPPSVAGLTFVGWQQPIACGGVAVFPDDLIVTDRDGAVVVPQALIQEVAELGLEQERLEGWIMKEVQNGAKLQIGSAHV